MEYEYIIKQLECFQQMNIIFCQEPNQKRNKINQLIKLFRFSDSSQSQNKSHELPNQENGSIHQTACKPMMNFFSKIGNYITSRFMKQTQEQQQIINLEAAISAIRNYQNNLSPQIQSDPSLQSQRQTKKMKQLLRNRYYKILKKQEQQKMKKFRQDNQIKETKSIYDNTFQNKDNDKDMTHKKQLTKQGKSIRTYKIKTYSVPRKQVEEEYAEYYDGQDHMMRTQYRSKIWKNSYIDRDSIRQLQRQQSKQHRNQGVKNSNKQSNRQQQEPSIKDGSSEQQSQVQKNDKIVRVEDRKQGGSQSSQISQHVQIKIIGRNNSNVEQSKIQNHANPFLSKSCGKLDLSAIISGKFQRQSNTQTQTLTQNQQPVQNMQFQQQTQQKHTFETSNQITANQIFANHTTSNFSFTPNIPSSTNPSFMNNHHNYQHQDHNNSQHQQQITQNYPIQSNSQSFRTSNPSNFQPLNLPIPSINSLSQQQFNRNAIAMFFGQNHKKPQSLFDNIQKTNKKSRVNPRRSKNPTRIS